MDVFTRRRSRLLLLFFVAASALPSLAVEPVDTAAIANIIKTNFTAEFKRQSDGTWKIVWYSVSNMEKSHSKRP